MSQNTRNTLHATKVREYVVAVLKASGAGLSVDEIVPRVAVYADMKLQGDYYPDFAVIRRACDALERENKLSSYLTPARRRRWFVKGA